MKNTIFLQFLLEFNAKLMDISGSLQDKGELDEAQKVYQVALNMHRHVIDPLFVNE